MVLIDARNVLRSQWPNVPEQELVRRALDWAERHDRPLREGAGADRLVGGGAFLLELNA